MIFSINYSFSLQMLNKKEIEMIFPPAAYSIVYTFLVSIAKFQNIGGKILNYQRKCHHFQEYIV